MKLKINYNLILLTTFFIGTLIFSTSLFVEKETLPKVYIFIFFGLIFGAFSLFKNSQSIRWDRLAVSIFIFIGYLLISTVATGGISLEILKLIGFLLLFLYFKNSDIEGKYLKTIIISLCLLQAIYGLFQYFQIIRITSAFSIIGSYDNPAGFATCLAVALPFAFSLLRESKYYKLLAIVAMFVIGCAVVLSQSRAGIVSLGVVSLIFFLKEVGIANSHRQEKWQKMRKFLIPFFIITGVAVFLLLLSIKKESASGRVLIWGNTWKMIQDAPILGHGNGAFVAKYMDYQADYFVQNPESKYAMLADNVLHPFNEYLLLVVEYGFVGLGLLLIGLFFLFSKRDCHKRTRISQISANLRKWECKMLVFNEPNFAPIRANSRNLCSKNFQNRHGENLPYLLCIISPTVFALFSYPLKYPFVWAIMAYCLAEISKSQKPVFAFSFPNKKWFRIIMLMCFIVGGYFLAKDISFEYQWNKIAKTSLLGKTIEVMPEYEHLHRIWNGNYLFLYNYGAELNHIKEYKKSNIILSQCLKYFNDYDVQMLLADNYSNLKQWNKAEMHYIRAADMCPVRFLPLSKLMNLYDFIEQHDKAIEVALKIINKPVKIESPTVRNIKFEAKKRIENKDK
jgi:O-antigen ligase